MNWRTWGWLALFGFLGGWTANHTRELLSPAPLAAQPPSPFPSPTLPLPSPIPPNSTLPSATLPSARLPSARLPSARLPSAAPADVWDAAGLTPEERVNIYVYERANRSVVNITTKSVRADRFWFAAVPQEGAGSGSVLDARGHILTNFHVVEGAQAVNVTLFDGETYEASLVGQDPENDIAVLKITAPEESLFPIDWSDSGQLRVGQKVYAIGNPFGLERTLTTGIVSSLNRTLPSRGQRNMKSMVQIDAALNRGNSGGPLLNSHGQLIGMNTAIASSTGENTGVGFSIPAVTIRRVVPQILAHGRVIRPDLGIAHALPDDQGLIIAALTPGGPAERAGLKGFRVVREQQSRGLFVVERTYLDRRAADRILAVDNQSVKDMDELLTVIEARQPGDRVTLTIVRDSREQNVAVQLGVAE